MLQGQRSMMLAFYLVLASVLLLTLVSLAACFGLVLLVPTPSDQVKQLIDACSTTWKMGFAAILGLISGRIVFSETSDPSHIKSSAPAKPTDDCGGGRSTIG